MEVRTALADLAAGAAQTLAAAGLPLDESRRDAALLARWRLGWTAAEWLSRASEVAPPGFSDGFDTLIERRARREPLAYITGEREFYGRAFEVTRDVLIPRPETEFLVEEALVCLRKIHGGHPGRDDAGQGGHERTRVLDIGTGTGCVAITIALEAPGAEITATDVSSAALRVAQANARRLGAARIDFEVASLADDFSRTFDLVVSNPPYVPEADRAALAPEVRDYEPAGALFAGPEGLDVIRDLVPSAAAALRPAGWLVIEIGYGQADAVVDLFRASGFWQIRTVPDLQSIPRVVSGRI